MSWAQKPLREVATRIAVGIPVSRYAAKEGESGDPIRVVNISDIEDGQLSDTDPAQAVQLQKGSYERFLLGPGDVLVSCRGTILKSAYVRRMKQRTVASSNFIVIRLHDTVHPAVLVAMTRSTQWRTTVQRRTRSTSGILQLTIKDLQDLPVVMLPDDGQRALAELLDAESEYRRLARAAADTRSVMTAHLVDELLRP